VITSICDSEKRQEDAQMDPKVKRALVVSVIEGILAVLINQFFGGAYLTGYFLWMGASSFFIGIFGSIPYFANMLQMLSLVYLHKLKSRKQLIVPLMWTARTSILLFALFPLMKRWGLLFSYLLYLYIQIAGAISSPLWQSWMADLVPTGTLGNYFGFRNLVLGLVQIPAMLVAGFILDSLGENIKGFAVLFLIAGSVGLLNGYFLKIQYEPPYVQREASLGFLQTLKILMKNKNYRNFLIGFTFWEFALGISGPYINVMLLREVKFSYSEISLMNAVNMFIGSLFQPFWGRAGDKYGFQYFLKVCVWAQAFAILLWALTPKSFLYVLLLQIYIGVFVTAGTSQLIFYNLMQVSPPDLKTEAFSLYNGFVNFALFLGSILSGAIVSCFEWLNVKVWYLNVTSVRLVLFISFVLRIFAATMITKLEFGRPKQVTVVQLIRETFVNDVIPWIRGFTANLKIFRKRY